MTRMCVGTILHTGSNSNIDKLAIAIRNETYYTQDFIQPCKLDYEEPQVGWSRIIHPEGAPYYSAKFGNMFVYTDTELRVPEYLGYVRDFIDALLNASGRLPHGSRALVLELKFEDGPDRRKPLCFYYFVDHEKRLIFWVHQVTIRNVCGNVRGVKSEGHLRYAIHTHYWHHCERYPSNFPYAQELYTHLQRILIVANADSMLSDTPLGPFESTDLQRLLNLMPMVKGQMDSDTDSDPAVTVLARVMRLFCQYRFLNSYGQVGARLGGGRSVFSRRKVNEEPVSWFFQCVDIALLRAPISHLRGIQTIWVDEMIDESRWKTYISSLNTEWNGFTIYSTVMLAVDVSFLAVPGVQAASGDPQSGATIAIYASVISSVCALIISVILAGQIRTHDVDSVGGGADYMVRMTRKAHGIKVLAVMFSLPYSLLLWAMLSFVVALGLVVFDTSDTLTLATMIPVWGVVILLALLPLWWKRLPSFAFAVAHPRRRLQQRHP
ncbi:hypothetical protein BDN67DRAFT_948586 [Paxillus ammoniavirescens]|nr:hypothetical protein BDN67DRAFT_948586 [Paxillus ammoniavirescens]